MVTKKKGKSERAKRLESVRDRLFIETPDGRKVKTHKPLISIDYPGQYALPLPSDPDRSKRRDFHGHMLDIAYHLWKHQDEYSDEDYNGHIEHLKEYGKDDYVGQGPATKLSKEAALEYTDVVLKELREEIKYNESSNREESFRKNQERFYLRKIKEVKQMREDIKDYWNEIEGMVHAEKRRKHKNLADMVSGVIAITFGTLAVFSFSGITGNAIGGGNSNSYGLIFVAIAIAFAGLYFWKKRK